jgi:hypothetical protein
MGYNQIRANASGSSAITFEEFLREAQRAGLADPGSAMMEVLRSRRIPGISHEHILSSASLNPCGKPANLLAFLRYICESGAWGVNLTVCVD